MDATSTYRQLLSDEFNRRHSRNTSYSLRAYARDIGLEPSKLCQILKGKAGVSGAKAKIVADKIGFEGQMKEFFVNLVEKEHARSRQAKANAENRLKDLSQSAIFNDITLQSFEIISDWIHFAILELVEVDNFNPSLAKIAKRLNVYESTVKLAVTRLQKMGLLIIDKNGKWRQSEGNLQTPTNIPSKPIRDYHLQVLNLAEKSLTVAPVAERDFGALTLAFNRDQIEPAKKMIREFRKDFNRKFGNQRKKDSVFCLSTQLFQLDKTPNNLETP